MVSIESPHRPVKFRNSKSYVIFSLLLSLTYAFLLAYFIPMSDEIKDRAHYLTYADDSNLIALKYFHQGILSFFFNEPAWLGVNILLSIYLRPEEVVFVIVFFSAALSSFLILRVNPKYFLFLVLILCLPQVIVKYVVHLRQGLAISIFLIGWFTTQTYRRWLLFLFACLIHASFFFIIGLYAMSTLMRHLNFSVDLRTFVTVIFGLTVSFGLGIAASVLGARQAQQYDFSMPETSGLGFVFWVGVLFLYWIQGRSFTRLHSFSITAIVFYLTTYFFIEVTGRIFESALIIVLLSSIDLKSWRKRLFLLVLPLYGLIMWMLRINEPWLGWGTGL